MLVEGNYDQIRANALNFASEKLSENVQSADIIMTIGIYLSMSSLEDPEKETLLMLVAEMCDKTATQRQVNVEQYSATKELIYSISPY